MTILSEKDCEEIEARVKALDTQGQYGGGFAFPPDMRDLLSTVRELRGVLGEAHGWIDTCGRAHIQTPALKKVLANLCARIDSIAGEPTPTPGPHGPGPHG